MRIRKTRRLILETLATLSTMGKKIRYSYFSGSVRSQSNSLFNKARIVARYEKSEKKSQRPFSFEYEED